MNEWFIKLFRSLLDWEWYDDINVTRLFIHLLLKANYSDSKWRWIEIKRWENLTTLENLCKETWLSVQSIRTVLKKLKSTNEITVKSTSSFSIIKLNNFDKYQDNNTEINKQVTNKQQTSNKQSTYKEEEKERKEEKEINYNNNSEIEISENLGNETENFSSYENLEKQNSEINAEPTEQESKKSSAAENQKSLEVVKKESNQDIDNLIIELKTLCDEVWVAYDKSHERNFAKHILTAKEFGNFSNNLGQSRIEFAKNILKASLQINFWKICSWPKLIYQNYAEVYNKTLIFKNNWKIWQLRQQSKILTI